MREREGTGHRGPDPVLDAFVRAVEPARPSTVLAYLKARAMPGVELVGPDFYCRVVRLPDGVPQIARFRVGETEPSGGVRVTVSQAVNRQVLRQVVNGIFRLDSAVQLAEAELARDAILGPIVARQAGLRIPGTPDGFELAVRAILGQQVSVVRAARVASAICRRFGDVVPSPALGLTHAFPAPAALVDADLTQFGLPRMRQRAISALAANVLDARVFLDGTMSVSETTKALGAVPGIGPWTTSYIALRALGDLDSIPLQDVGLRTAISHGGPMVSPIRLELVAEAWRPWRGLAATHLWTTLLPDFQPTSSG